MNAATTRKMTKTAIPTRLHHVTTSAGADSCTSLMHVEASKAAVAKVKVAASYVTAELPFAGRVAEAKMAKPITAGAAVGDQRGRG
jgi:hypothetical protein